MATSTLPKDKLILDLTDKEDKDLAEHLSRMEPGDVLTGKFKASLDENSDGLAVLSIVEIIADPAIEPPKKNKKNKSTDVATDEVAAIKLMSDRSEESDLPPESTPSGEPSARQAPSQPYSPDELVK